MDITWEYNRDLVGVFNPSANISQLGWLFPIYGKIENVPNHQPGDIIGLVTSGIYHQLDMINIGAPVPGHTTIMKEIPYHGI